MESDISAQVRSIEERLARCIEERRYDDARVMGKDILPLMRDEGYAVRLRVYTMLQRCPGFELSDIHRWTARMVAEDVMADRARSLEERIRAHILRLMLGQFPCGASPPEGSGAEPNHRWLPQELRELYAEEAATKLLGRGGETDRALRRDAHIVCCFTCPDHQSVAAHLEALLVDGDEDAIVQGCCGASEEFHRETACRFLNSALAAVAKEKAIARLLEYKLSVLLGLYMRGAGGEAEECEERHSAYGDFVATMTRLELCGGAPLERAHGHLYFAILADWFGECALAEVHCDVAKALAEHLQNPGFQQLVAHCRECILSEENGEEQWEDGEEEDGAVGYDEDDDDDDDDGEEWQMA